LAQKSDLESRDIVGVLPLQGVKRTTQISPAAFNDLAGEFGNALTKNQAQPLVVEIDEPVDEQPRHQQQFSTVRQMIGKEALNAENIGEGNRRYGTLPETTE
jgi:hypothetical protein